MKIVEGVDVNFDDLSRYILLGQDVRLNAKLDSVDHLSDDLKDELLLYATLRSQEKIIIELLKRGANKDKVLLGGSSLICYAIAADMKDLVGFLIFSGVDLNKADEDGATPLLEAITSENYELARLLIARGADVNKKAMDLRPSEEIKKRGWKF